MAADSPHHKQIHEKSAKLHQGINESSTVIVILILKFEEEIKLPLYVSIRTSLLGIWGIQYRCRSCIIDLVLLLHLAVGVNSVFFESIDVYYHFIRCSIFNEHHSLVQKGVRIDGGLFYFILLLVVVHSVPGENVD